MLEKDCFIVFDLDGVLIGEEGVDYIVKLSTSSSKRKIGIQMLEEASHRGKIIVVTGRHISEKRNTIELLSEMGINVNIIRKFKFREEDISPREWKLKAIRMIAEEGSVCEVHDDDETLLSELKRDPLFRKTKLYLYRGLVAFPF